MHKHHAGKCYVGEPQYGQYDPRHIGAFVIAPVCQIACSQRINGHGEHQESFSTRLQLVCMDHQQGPQQHWQQ